MPSGIRRRRADRSGQAKPTRRRYKKQTKSRDVTSNPIMSEHWDHNLTLTQNYRRLGLASKLQRHAGGLEKNLVASQKVPEVQPIGKGKPTVRQGRIVHDADGSSHVEYYQDEQSDDEPEEWHGFADESDLVKQLEDYAKQEVKDCRHMSTTEQSALKLLVDRYGEDYEAMQWDKKLNKFQHSAGDLRRRIKKMLAAK